MEFQFKNSFILHFNFVTKNVSYLTLHSVIYAVLQLILISIDA